MSALITFCTLHLPIMFPNLVWTFETSKTNTLSIKLHLKVTKVYKPSAGKYALVAAGKKLDYWYTAIEMLNRYKLYQSSHPESFFSRVITGCCCSSSTLGGSRSFQMTDGGSFRKLFLLLN